MNLKRGKVGKDARVKAKVARSKKAAVKKPVASKKPVRKAVVKPVSTTDAVLAAIKRSRRPVDPSALRERTGIEGRKLYDALTRLKRKGQIKSPNRGLYVKA